MHLLQLRADMLHMNTNTFMNQVHMTVLFRDDRKSANLMKLYHREERKLNPTFLYAT